MMAMLTRVDGLPIGLLGKTDVSAENRKRCLLAVLSYIIRAVANLSFCIVVCIPCLFAINAFFST